MRGCIWKTSEQNLPRISAERWPGSLWADVPQVSGGLRRRRWAQREQASRCGFCRGRRRAGFSRRCTRGHCRLGYVERRERQSIRPGQSKGQSCSILPP